jgi:hypothetical protein
VEAFATPARLSAVKAVALPIMARLKIAAAAKTDFGPDIFVAPIGFPSSATTRPAIAGFPIPTVAETYAPKISKTKQQRSNHSAIGAKARIACGWMLHRAMA